MKATLGQIEAFYWIARLGSFRSAATVLNLTQPTISLRIQTLEAALGTQLFERLGRRTRLTRDGTALLPRADRLMSIASEFGSRHVRDDPLRGRLRIGAPDSFGLVCMPEVVQALRRECPELEIALVIDNSAALSQKLNERSLDLAFLANPKTGPHVGLELLGSQSLAWIAGTRRRFPAYITPADLEHEEILTNPAPANLVLSIEQWFATAGLRPSRIGTCTSLSVILRLVAAGSGVAILPTAILPPDRKAANVRILRSRPEVPQEQLFAAYLVEKLGPALKASLAIARRAALASKLFA